MGFAQREQALRLGIEGVDAGRGPRLPPVYAVVVAARADLRTLRRVGGSHGGGQRRVQVFCEAANFSLGSPPGLRLAELALGLTGRVEQFRPPCGECLVGLVLLLRLGARLMQKHSP